MLCQIYTTQKEVHMAIRHENELEHKHHILKAGLMVAINRKSRVFLDTKQE
jgi:hypothetical protein